MKKQSKKSPLFRGLLLAALSGLGTTAFAQGADVCQGTGYTIADAVPASSGSEYRWLENVNVLANTNQATYNVPNNKATGVYTYVRQSKSADCPDWQSSNEFTVTVFACSFTAGTVTGATATFTDPRDGKRYKTVVMPDGKTWFAQNLNYTKDLVYNAYSHEANGKQFTSTDNGIPAIGSYWCPPAGGSIASGDEAACRVYGAFYTWETVMMVDGKYANEAKTNSMWDESWVSNNYYNMGTTPGTTTNADKNNARGGTSVKGGGRGICPMGWHIPTDREWAQMLDKVEGNTTFTASQTDGNWWGTDAGKKLKSAATYTGTEPGNGAWQEHATTRGTDNYGFSAVPTGYRISDGSQFLRRGIYADCWSSSVANGRVAWYRQFSYNNAQVARGFDSRSYGFSVRCVRN
jgi:uncharacterized protein (TIGR02145 family)